MKAALLLALGILLVCALPGQSNRYWNVNFNAEASLLSGAVVGGGAGVSSIYYNPALLTEVEQQKSTLPISSASISINVNLFSLELYSLKNVFGTGEDLNESDLGIQPRFFSFLLRPDKRQRISMEFAYLTRDESSFELAEGSQLRGDFFPEVPGEEIYSLGFDLQSRYKDKWYGLGAGYEILPGFSVGASMFTSFKSETQRFRVSGKVYSSSDSIYMGGEPVATEVSSVELYERIRQHNNQIILKFGIRLTRDIWSVGLAMTTPALSINNRAEVTKEYHQINVYDAQSGSYLPDIVIADFQKNLSSKTKLPLSLALGVNFSHPNNRLMISTSVEYFQSIAPYKAIEGQVNPDITNKEVFESLPQKDWLTRVSGAREILNAGVGIRYNVSSKLVILGGFRTDFNYVKDFSYEELEAYSSQRSIDYNVYHLVGGARFNIMRHNVILGLQYSHGAERNIPNLGEWGGLLDSVTGALPYPFPAGGNGMDSNYNALGMFFGLTLNFGKEKDE